MTLPGSRPLTLAEEARQLLRYTSLQRAEYLNEVWCEPKRGPGVADELQRELAKALREASNGQPATVGQNRARPVGRR